MSKDASQKGSRGFRCILPLFHLENIKQVPVSVSLGLIEACPALSCAQARPRPLAGPSPLCSRLGTAPAGCPAAVVSCRGACHVRATFAAGLLVESERAHTQAQLCWLWALLPGCGSVSPAQGGWGSLPCSLTHQG